MHDSGTRLRAPRRGRVLVIDDEPLVARALAIFIKAEHDVVTSTSAKEALARLDAGEPFDVILCDLMMPQMSGIDFYEALASKHPELVDRLVLITGGAFTRAARDFLARGVVECVEKPPNPPELRAVIRRRVDEIDAATAAKAGTAE